MEKRLSNEYATVLANIRGIRNEKMEQLAEMSPEYAQIRDEYTRLCRLAINAAVSGEGYEEAMERMMAFAEDMQGMQKLILKRLNLPDDFLRPEYDCPICKDTGYVGSYERRLCSCAKAKRMQQSDLSRLPRFSDFNEAIYQSDEQRRQAKKLRDYLMGYAAAFPDNDRPNMFINSAAGLGKTFLLGCAARDIAERGHRMQMLTAYELTQLFKGEHIEQKPCLNKLKKLDFLVIDDLGVEPIYKNISLEYMFILINERMQLRKPTAISSNLGLDSLQDKYGERLMSRILDKSLARYFVLNGKDLRLSVG